MGMILLLMYQLVTILTASVLLLLLVSTCTTLVHKVLIWMSLIYHKTIQKIQLLLLVHIIIIVAVEETSVFDCNDNKSIHPLVTVNKYVGDVSTITTAGITLFGIENSEHCIIRNTTITQSPKS